MDQWQISCEQEPQAGSLLCQSWNRRQLFQEHSRLPISCCRLPFQASWVTQNFSRTARSVARRLHLHLGRLRIIHWSTAALLISIGSWILAVLKAEVAMAQLAPPIPQTYQWVHCCTIRLGHPDLSATGSPKSCLRCGTWPTHRSKIVAKTNLDGIMITVASHLEWAVVFRLSLLSCVNGLLVLVVSNFRPICINLRSSKQMINPKSRFLIVKSNMPICIGCSDSGWLLSYAKSHHTHHTTVHITTGTITTSESDNVTKCSCRLSALW